MFLTKVDQISIRINTEHSILSCFLHCGIIMIFFNGWFQQVMPDGTNILGSNWLQLSFCHKCQWVSTIDQSPTNDCNHADLIEVISITFHICINLNSSENMLHKHFEVLIFWESKQIICHSLPFVVQIIIWNWWWICFY